MIIGIDEVGRGPLAGPVVAAAILVPEGIRFGSRRLKDSKRLTKVQRENWWNYLKNHPAILYAHSRVYPKTIDRINISRAADLAATRALAKLILKEEKTGGFGLKQARIFLDGGLHVQSEKFKNFKIATIIGGDEKIKAIQLASIVAKVKRDGLMKKMHRRYPQYSFDRHKGYGTKAHFAAIKAHGLSPLHRLTFVKQYHKIKSK